MSFNFIILAALALTASMVAAWWITQWIQGPHQRALTECKHQLAKERIKIETLVQSISDGLVITNLRGEALYINAEAVEILGAKPEEVTSSNKGLFELINKDQFRMKIQRILKNHTHSEVTELQILSDGNHETRYFRTSVKIFTSHDEGDFGVALILRDVSAEKKMDALKDEFFQSVAHELRAPLFAIQGYLRLLEKSISPDKQQKSYFDLISQSCEKLTLSIQDTLDSARIETGNFDLTLTPLNPAALLKRTVDIFSPLALEKKIYLELNLPKTGAETIEADERLLERLFHTLLSNAIKSTMTGGEIKVALNKAGASEMEFSVADSGPGIPEDQKSRIFEKYPQLSGGDENNGLGMGLYICRKIAGLHNGAIWVDSQLGSGSQFILRLPVKQAGISKP